MNVELDIYSGRPNPTWTLAPHEAAHVEQLLADLPRASSQPDGGLGYRGFELADGQRHIRVCSGVIRVQTGEDLQFFQDQKGLEKYLQSLAGGRGFLLH